MSSNPIRYLAATDCPDAARHTRRYKDEPGGYMAWHDWAERKYRTHYQIRCPTCGYYAIWLKRKQPLTNAQMAVLFPHSGYETEGART